MKISFSTLACPDYSWTEIYTMAKDLGFDGIEVRGLGEDIFAVNARPFTDARLPQTVEKLRSLNLEIPCLASGCSLKSKKDFDKNISEITQYVVLAKKLGTPYIRQNTDLGGAQRAGKVDILPDFRLCLLRLVRKFQCAAGGEAGDFQPHTVQLVNGFVQVLFFKGFRIYGKDVLPQPADFNSAEAKVLRHGVDVGPGKIRTAQGGKCKFHHSSPFRRVRHRFLVGDKKTFVPCTCKRRR